MGIPAQVLKLAQWVLHQLSHLPAHLLVFGGKILLTLPRSASNSWAQPIFLLQSPTASVARTTDSCHRLVVLTSRASFSFYPRSHKGHFCKDKVGKEKLQALGYRVLKGQKKNKCLPGHNHTLLPRLQLCTF